MGGSDWPANRVPTRWQDSSTFRTQSKKEGWAYFSSPLSNLMASVGCASAPSSAQARARPRDGAPRSVLGTLSLNPSHRCSTGHGRNAPSRGEVGRGPAGFALDSGQSVLVADLQTYRALANAPSRGEVPSQRLQRAIACRAMGRGPAAHSRLDSGQGVRLAGVRPYTAPVGCASAHHHSIHPGIRKSRQK